MYYIPATRKSYHTNLKLAVHLDLLPHSLAYDIPKSTLSTWKKIKPEHYVGSDCSTIIENIEVLKELAQCKAALTSARMVLRLVALARRVSAIGTHIAAIQNPEVRTRIVHTVLRISQHLGLGRCLKLLQLPVAIFARWRRNAQICSSSPFSRCRTTYPTQLTRRELSIINKAYLDPDFQHWPSIAIAWRLIHSQALACSVHTITRYAKSMGLTAGRVVRKKRRYGKSIVTNRPHAAWHVDCTFIHSADGIKQAVSFIIDNFSRKILSFRVAVRLSWESTVAALTEAYQTVQADQVAEPIQLISDGGPENDNQHVAFCVQELAIKHCIAKRDVSFSNSIIEAWNKILKYRYLFRKPLPHHVDMPRAIQEAVDDYNNRPHSSLKGLTPNQACSGVVFDVADYRSRLAEAREERREINAKACPPCVSWKN
jgi:transposase InsO family protein